MVPLSASSGFAAMVLYPMIIENEALAWHTFNL